MNLRLAGWKLSINMELITMPGDDLNEDDGQARKIRLLAISKAIAIFIFVSKVGLDFIRIIC